MYYFNSFGHHVVTEAGHYRMGAGYIDTDNECWLDTCLYDENQEQDTWANLYRRVAAEKGL